MEAGQQHGGTDGGREKEGLEGWSQTLWAALSCWESALPIVQQHPPFFLHRPLCPPPAVLLYNRLGVEALMLTYSYKHFIWTFSVLYYTKGSELQPEGRNWSALKASCVSVSCHFPVPFILCFNFDVMRMAVVKSISIKVCLFSTCCQSEPTQYVCRASESNMACLSWPHPQPKLCEAQAAVCVCFMSQPNTHTGSFHLTSVKSDTITCFFYPDLIYFSKWVSCE